MVDTCQKRPTKQKQTKDPGKPLKAIAAVSITTVRVNSKFVRAEECIPFVAARIEKMVAWAVESVLRSVPAMWLFFCMRRYFLDVFTCCFGHLQLSLRGICKLSEWNSRKRILYGILAIVSFVFSAVPLTTKTVRSVYALMNSYPTTNCAYNINST